MKRNDAMRLSAAAVVIALCGSTLNAEDYDPTGQAGEYATVKMGTIIRGGGGNFENITIHVPWITCNDTTVGGFCPNGPDGLYNACAVQARVNVTTGNLEPFGAMSQSGSAINAVRCVAILGTVDVPNPGPNGPAMVSNNIVLDEGSSNRSNSLGTLLSGGTLVFREAFSSAGGIQNNIGYETNVSVLPQEAFPEGQVAANKVFGAFPGIDSAGSVFLGTPGAVRNSGGALLVGQTTFTADDVTPDAIIGTGVWTAPGADPLAPTEAWLQATLPAGALPAGELIADMRQTQPVLEAVSENGRGVGDVYICFGVGNSGAAPIDGGSAEPYTLVVDRVDGDSWANAVFIDADVAGPGNAGATLAGGADLVNQIPGTFFLDHQATGGGSGPFINSLFDMNSSGQVVAVHEVEGAPNVNQIRLYNPIWSGGRITGYSAPVIVAQSGQDGILTNGDLPLTAGSLTPFSGVAIDNDGLVSFVAVTEAMLDGLPPSVLWTTNTLFVWAPPGYAGASGETLIAVAEGGQNGDVLADIDGGVSLALGTFSVDPQNNSDTFTRASLSDFGGFIAANFRSGPPDDAVINGGVLNPDDGMGAVEDETSVRGTVIISLGAFTPAVGCDGDADGNLAVNVNDISFVVFRLGNSGAPCIPGDVDGNGAVNVNDISYVIFRLGTCNPGGPC